MVDDYVVSGLLQASSDVYPMMEREGGYLGPPVDGDEALQQLDRLRTRGTIRLAFVFNVFWWLDHYHALRTYVLREGRIIHASPVLKANQSRILGVAAGHRRRASNVVIGSMFQEQHDRTGQMGDARPSGTAGPTRSHGRSEQQAGPSRAEKTMIGKLGMSPLLVEDVYNRHCRPHPSGVPKPSRSLLLELLWSA